MKAFKTLLLLLALGLSVYGQAVNVTANKLKGSATAPSGACSAQQVQLTTAGVVYVCASGTWTSSGGGTTINSTNGQVPYRVNSTTFGDSAFASNALNSTYLSATSGASGDGLTLTVAGGGTTEVLKLIAKGNSYTQVGSGGGSPSTDPGLVLTRLLDNTNGSGNAHAFVDSSTFSRTTGGPNGYASFDTPVSVGTAAAYDHYVSYQARPTTVASSTWSHIFGAYYTATFGASSTATRNIGVWVAPPVMGSGASITNNVGVWIDGTTAPGAFNYSLMSTGVSYFMNHAGAVSLGSTTNPSVALHMRGNSTRESLFRFTPNSNSQFVGAEWTDNTNLGVIASIKVKATTGELQINGSTTTFLTFYANAVEAARITTAGNMKIAGTAVRGTTEGTNHLDIFDGTAPVGTLTNGISLYSTSGELRVMDAAGNATLLSPHDHVTNEWIYYSVNTVTGKVLKIEMEKMLRYLNAYFGTDFVKEFRSEAEARPDLRKH